MQCLFSLLPNLCLPTLLFFLENLLDHLSSAVAPNYIPLPEGWLSLLPGDGSFREVSKGQESSEDIDFCVVLHEGGF